MRLIAAVMALLSPLALDASQSYHPPPSGEAWKTTKVYLKGEEGSAAQGCVAFLCNESERQHRVQVYARGLEPGVAYSLWLRQIEDGKVIRQKRVTRRYFPPRADKTGTFSQVLSLLHCPVATYNDVVLARGGDTSDGVLFGAILAATHEEEGGDKSGAPGSH